MNVTFSCPSCQGGVRQHFDETTASLQCPHCGEEVRTPPGSVEGRRVRRCLACPSTDLFVRKDFPQRLGVALVAVGVVGSSIAWYYANLGWTFGILFATALADVALFLLVGDALMCYRCGALYRGVEDLDAHGQFDLETHEKHRQTAARLRTTAGHS